MSRTCGWSRSCLWWSGAVNWGLVGLAQFDLVATLFGGSASVISRVVYSLVGIAGLLVVMQAPLQPRRLPTGHLRPWLAADSNLAWGDGAGYGASDNSGRTGFFPRTRSRNLSFSEEAVSMKRIRRRHHAGSAGRPRQRHVRAEQRGQGREGHRGHRRRGRTIQDAGHAAVKAPAWWTR